MPEYKKIEAARIGAFLIKFDNLPAGRRADFAMAADTIEVLREVDAILFPNDEVKVIAPDQPICIADFAVELIEEIEAIKV